MPKPYGSVLADITAKPTRPRREPLWKGPCALGKLGGLTQSMISSWLCDKERFRIKVIDGLKPVDS